jgi:hypothetical protein
LQCVPLAWVLAASLAAPHVLAAATPQPPPLPPDTVNQFGLSWDLHAIGTRLATTPFRFSLCEGRYLAPDEVSVPCRPSNRATVHGGHQAPYTFSAGHGQPLPAGLRIDGNGILHGDDPGVLSALPGGKLPLCVRQLDVERCPDVFIEKEIAIVPDNIARAIDKGIGPPKKGHGAGAAVAVLGAIAAGGVGLAVAANSLKTAEEDASCGAKPVWASMPPTSSEIAQYRSWCVCLGYRTSGTASNGDYTCLN